MSPETRPCMCAKSLLNNHRIVSPLEGLRSERRIRIPDHLHEGDVAQVVYHLVHQLLVNNVPVDSDAVAAFVIATVVLVVEESDLIALTLTSEQMVKARDALKPCLQMLAIDPVPSKVNFHVLARGCQISDRANVPAVVPRVFVIVVAAPNALANVFLTGFAADGLISSARIEDRDPTNSSDWRFPRESFPDPNGNT